jgi:hypothetical protein
MGWTEDGEGHLASAAACPPSHLASDAARLRRSSLPPPGLHLASTVAPGAPPLRRGLPMAQPQPPLDDAPGFGRRSTRGSKSERDARRPLPSPREEGPLLRRSAPTWTAAEETEGPWCHRSYFASALAWRSCAKGPRPWRCRGGERRGGHSRGESTRSTGCAKARMSEEPIAAAGLSPSGWETASRSNLAAVGFRDGGSRSCCCPERRGCRDGGLLCRARVAGAGGGVKDREKEWGWWWDRGIGSRAVEMRCPHDWATAPGCCIRHCRCYSGHWCRISQMQRRFQMPPESV